MTSYTWPWLKFQFITYVHSNECNMDTNFQKIPKISKLVQGQINWIMEKSNDLATLTQVMHAEHIVTFTDSKVAFFFKCTNGTCSELTVQLTKDDNLKLHVSTYIACYKHTHTHAYKAHQHIYIIRTDIHWTHGGWGVVNKKKRCQL